MKAGLIRFGLFSATIMSFALIKEYLVMNNVVGALCVILTVALIWQIISFIVFMNKWENQDESNN